MKSIYIHIKSKFYFRNADHKPKLRLISIAKNSFDNLKLMSIPQSKPPLRNQDEGSWKYEKTSEASIVGYHFAQTIASIASGKINTDTILKQSKETKNFPAFKKIFWEEKRYNPTIENAHIDYSIDAHIREESTYWKKCGKKFRTGERFEQARDHFGPLLPGEHEKLYEKPIKMFGRNRKINPFHIARQYNQPVERFNEASVILKVSIYIVKIL